MAVLMASLNGLYIASFPQKMGHHIICYEYRHIFLTTVTVPTSKKRLSGGARVVKHAPLARPGRSAYFSQPGTYEHEMAHFRSFRFPIPHRLLLFFDLKTESSL